MIHFLLPYCVLTYLPLGQKSAISQTTFSNAFSWKKLFVLWFEFHWSSHDDVIKWKHFPPYWPFVWGFHRPRVTGQRHVVLMLSLTCAWVNNRETGDLRHHHVHYDVTVMLRIHLTISQHWFKWWLGTEQATNHYLNQWQWGKWVKVYWCTVYVDVFMILCALCSFFEMSCQSIWAASFYQQWNARLIRKYTLRWRRNGHGGVSNHQPHHCLLNRLFGCRSKKTSKVRVTGLCVGNSPGTGEFPSQMASNAENVSIWWRHHEEQTSESKSPILLSDWNTCYG